MLPYILDGSLSKPYALVHSRSPKTGSNNYEIYQDMLLLWLSKGICQAINVKCKTRRYDNGCRPKNFKKKGKKPKGGGDPQTKLKSPQFKMLTSSR